MLEDAWDDILSNPHWWVVVPGAIMVLACLLAGSTPAWTAFLIVWGMYQCIVNLEAQNG